MFKKFGLPCFLFLSALYCSAQIKSPSAFLPHEHGEHFTPHYMIVDYVEYLAENSPNLELTTYGTSNQMRPLLLGFISSPENLAKLEAIRENNLKRVGLLEGATDPALDVAIVWLSYGVHGNEAGGPESAMSALYELLNPENSNTQTWLQNTVIVFDPTMNPDGYSRYTHWYRNVAPLLPDPNPQAREHNEPWPGGRVNHYLFDLNRDWAWQTQKESQQRLEVYHQWLPHIHVDFHEQYYDSPYYFAPAAKPYHKYITDWQASFQTAIGKNNARYFDEEGWLYFTREVFDLFYPSYGDTYPTFNGAIGMTYEQGGHSRAGRAITLETKDVLTLKDRIDHHTSTALSTVEMASRNKEALIENFQKYFNDSKNNPPGEYKTFIIKGNNPEGRLKAICKLLDKNKIVYGKVNNSTKIQAYNYQTGKEQSVSLQANDLVISAYQVFGLKTQVLLEPMSELEDSLTYDITAWALPYAYGLEAYASKEKITVTPGYTFEQVSYNVNTTNKAYAYLSRWNSMEDARFLSKLIQEDIHVRFTEKELQLEGAIYPPGSLIITRADNRKMSEEFDSKVNQIANAVNQKIIAVKTGFSDNGRDLGSGSMKYIQPPKVALVAGEGISNHSFGQAWYYFEQDIHYPVSILSKDQLKSFDLSTYNLLVFPEGGYNIDDSLLDKLNNWINGGGRLIVIGYSLNSIEGKSGFKLAKYATDEARNKAKRQKEQADLANRNHDYGGQNRRWISNFIPGAIFKVNIDNTHPLGFGMSDYYFSLKTNSMHYQLLKGVWNVGTLDDSLMVSGFAGNSIKQKMQNTVVFGVQEKGSGTVTYMVDNPLYRSFWENGKFLFSNAVFMVGN